MSIALKNCRALEGQFEPSGMAARAHRFGPCRSVSGQRLASRFGKVLALLLAGHFLRLALPNASAELGHGPPEPTITERGLHHRRWETAYITERGGRVVTNLQHYTELQTGLHRLDPDVKDFVETDPRIELFQDGAVVRHLQYSVVFAPNLASPGAIDILLPDSQRLTG